MNKVVSRQRQWQIDNPTNAKLLRQQTKTRQRYALLKQGYGMTHKEICEYIDGYEKRHGKVADSEWWNIYEYLDWKYNNSAICKPAVQTQELRSVTKRRRNDLQTPPHI